MTNKQDFTMEVTADNNFLILNRILNVLTRRRVRIKQLTAHEHADDFHKGKALLVLYTTEEMIEKVKVQIEKLIEVEFVQYDKGSHAYPSITQPYAHLTT